MRYRTGSADTFGLVEPGPNPFPSQTAEQHFLLRCHRIALDFGPEAAERALLHYKRSGKS